MGGIGWQRLPDDLPAEARELAEELRMLFGSLELSMRRYALRCHCDVSTVSRYLNGLHTPPWSFIEGLLSHAAQGRAEPVTQEAATHLRRLHRKAVTSSGAAKGKAQQLHILLEQADEDARQSQAREQMAADMLHERQFRIQQLQVQLRAVEAARAVDRDEYDNALVQQHQQQEALRNECSRLYAEVGVLREQLTQATVAKELAEERCSQLELQLDVTNPLTITR
ncbi:helix-turn-helix domain-containing protein [Streptomyces coriariae]|uniref:helix-turn-helix domain-containing protein n=1 Tax=Streptomyces coriariae TaxID=2864460 RepID=UPI001E5B061D|nr:helix-turn-helix domain-containing protein [Streptomyces coriariae]